ncbi:Cullin-3B [Populus alba x Populus x berolinensis]|uniref:Cullin-3B n=1 Tax=Populus alba x Populus x berolinensis TaxID=444605 RepID=A0AAD6MDN1_9ROSI|nr:Cullin-3B [Populus alba x Populus x berolinensis]
MSNQKKRNFQIEAFKHRVVVDPKYADKTWKILEHAIHEIYNHNASGLSFEELYRSPSPSLSFNYCYYYYDDDDDELMMGTNFGYKMPTTWCSTNLVRSCIDGLVATMTSHLREISKSIEAAQGDSFLEELNRKWNDHNKALQMIRDILMDNIIHSSKIQTRLQNTLLELVHRERTGEVIDRGLMRNIVKMLMDLGSSVYQEDFEKPFLEVSAEFYRGESQNITNVVEKEMIANHMLILVHMENSGLVNMLLDDKYEDLGRMYNLVRRVPIWSFQQILKKKEK